MTIAALIEYGPKLEELKNRMRYPLDRVCIPQDKVEIILSAIREFKANNNECNPKEVKP